MFIDHVTSLDSGMRNKVETGEDLKRRTDDAYAKDFGKLAGNVAGESRAFWFNNNKIQFAKLYYMRKK